MSEAAYRIAMVAAGPFPTLRGSQVLVRELAEALVVAGHLVHVVAYGGGDSEIPVPGVRIHRTPAVFGDRYLHGPKWGRVGLNLLLLHTLYRVVRTEGIDVIHAHNYEAPLLGYVVRALTGVPVVYHGHNVMSDELGRYFRGRPSRWAARLLGGALDRSVPRRADYVVALSERMAASLRDNGVASHQLAVIPPGICPSNGAGDYDDGADPYPGTKVILYAGNLDPYQDLSTLVQAMGDVRRAEPDALLVVVTHAADTAAVREASRLESTPGVRVVVAGGFDVVQRLLRRADVVVCPRTSWSGFPIKLLNYMAAGRAIVAAAGAASAVHDGPMVVVPDHDVAELARAIVSTLRDPAARAILGRAARQLAHDRFAWPLLVPRIVQVYRDVVNEGPGSYGNLQECKKVLQKATLWGLMEGMGGRISPSRPGVG